MLQVLQWLSASCWLLHIVASVQQLYSEGNAGPHIPTSQRQLNQLIQRLSAQLRSTSPRIDETDSEHARMLAVAGGGGSGGGSIGAGSVRAHLTRHQKHKRDADNSSRGGGGGSFFGRLRHKQPHARLLSQPDSYSNRSTEQRSPLPSASADAMPSGDEHITLPSVLVHPPANSGANGGGGVGAGIDVVDGSVFRFSQVPDNRSLLDDMNHDNTERKPPQMRRQNHSNLADTSGVRANGHSSDRLSDDVFALIENAPRRSSTDPSTTPSRAAVAANTLGERCFTGGSGIELDDIDGRLPSPR